jgi:GT2 family glycosyltransferase
MTKPHIIIVNYNSGHWLTRSVRSALEFSRGRVTVVDNASQDSSVFDTQATTKSERLDWQLNDLNTGFAAANNQVLKEVESEFAVLMNPDCELNTNSLQPIIDQMLSHSDIGLASCRILNEDGSLQITCRRRFPTPWSAFVRMSQLNRIFPRNARFANFDYGDSVDPTQPVEDVEAVSGAFMVARMSAVQEVGLLDEDYFMHCEDLDWCKRFHLNGWKVAFVPVSSVLHAKGVSTKSRPIGVLYTLHTGMNRFIDKFYQTEYSLALRLLVKLGIIISFCVRVLGSLLSSSLAFLRSLVSPK